MNVDNKSESKLNFTLKVYINGVLDTDNNYI